MADSLAAIVPSETTIGRPTATTRRLVNASVSDNTRRAYAGALSQLDAWLDGPQLDDASLAAYLAELHDAGRAASSAAMTVAAARFRARLAGQADPAGEQTARVLAGYRGRGQARPFSAAGGQMAAARGRLDALIAGLLFMGGLRRSEVSALRWADVADAGDADGILVTVRRSKTNQAGETNDVRYLKNGAARAIRALRAAAAPAPWRATCKRDRAHGILATRSVQYGGLDVSRPVLLLRANPPGGARLLSRKNRP